jgi:hypothetical protein
MTPAGLGFGSGQGRGALPFEVFRENQCLALGVRQALHRNFGIDEQSECDLTPVTIRCIVRCAQHDVTARKLRGQRGSVDAVGFDSRKADLATVIQPEAATIDDLDNASLADLFEQARRRHRATGCA